MDIRDNYKSSLHYLALQSNDSGLSFEVFLLHLSNKDIGKLNLAISETVLRRAIHNRLGSFYNHNKITCMGEFKMIVKCKLDISKCEAAKVAIGINICHNVRYLTLVHSLI